jgi:DNA-binding CsgD family transcriptional regulator
MALDELPFHLLTETEKQCLRLVDQGFTSRDIAEERGVRSDSIDKILRIARRKLGDFDRRELALRLVAAEAGQERRDPVTIDKTAHIAPAQSLGVQSAGLDHDPETRPDDGLQQPSERGSSRAPRRAVTRLLDLTDGEILRNLLLGTQGSPSNELDSWSRMAAICVIAACGACGAAVLIPLLIVLERIAAWL